MAHIRKIERPGKPVRWQVVWRDRQTRKQSAKTLPTLREAKVMLRDVEQQHHEGKRPQTAAGNLTLEALVEMLPDPPKERTRILRRQALNRLGDLSGYAIKNVTPLKVERELRGFHGSARNQAISIVRRAYREALHQGYMGADPTDGLVLNQIVRQRPYLTAQEVERLAEMLGRYGDTVRVLAWTGLRGGELSALMVRDYDPGSQSLRVRATASYIAGEAAIEPPKTVNALRTVPVPERIAPILDAAAAGQPRDRWLWRSSNGRMWRPDNWRRNAGWYDAVVDMGHEELRVHDLRHTYASLARSAGVDLYTLSRIMGHASITITSTIYGGLYDGSLRTAAQQLDQL